MGMYLSNLVRVDSIAVLLGQQLSLGDVDHKSYDRYDEGICDQIREQR